MVAVTAFVIPSARRTNRVPKNAPITSAGLHSFQDLEESVVSRTEPDLPFQGWARFSREKHLPPRIWTQPCAAMASAMPTRHQLWNAPALAACKCFPIFLEPFQIGASASNQPDGRLARMHGDEPRQGEQVAAQGGDPHSLVRAFPAFAQFPPPLGTTDETHGARTPSQRIDHLPEQHRRMCSPVR